MRETKSLKALCTKTNRHFGLEIKKVGSEWKVVNFLEISADESKIMTSEIEQTRFLSNETLLACDRCGNRVVGGCNCRSRQCRSDKDSVGFQCLYCNYLKIDYSPAQAVVGYKEGDIVRLSQGQEIKIQSGTNPLERIIVGTGWDPTSNPRLSNMDIDSSVFVMGDNAYEIVYYAETEHPSGCVLHYGDNLTGVDIGPNEDDESIDVFLNKVPQDRNKLVFVLNIYRCRERNQNLSMVKNMYIRLYDPISHTSLAEYKVNDNLRYNTALIIGAAIRNSNGWTFKAIGKGSNAGAIDDLAFECFDLFE